MTEVKPLFKIYRLCRDRKSVERLEMEGRTYGLPSSVLITGGDYFGFIEDVLKNCSEDYALLCHDDVVVPLDIESRVEECIRKADMCCGADHWGVVGNAGIEAISLRMVRFLRDPHAAVIPYKSHPIPVVSVDGNTMLLNVRNMQRNHVELPAGLRGFHLYDFVTAAECYRKGLLTLVDSTLYVYHRSGGAQKGFDRFANGAEFQKYWSDNFINHKIYTVNGPVEVSSPNLDYLQEGSRDKRADFYAKVKSLILSVQPNREKPVINIITRTQLANVNRLSRLMESIELSQRANRTCLDLRLVVSVNNVQTADRDKVIEGLRTGFKDLNMTFVEGGSAGSMAPRVLAIKTALGAIPEGKNQFVWIVDDDDFILPKELALLPHYLHDDVIFIGKSEAFDEDWSGGHDLPDKSVARSGFYAEPFYARNYMGENHVPICSAIFPREALGAVFAKYKLAGDYYEDYALLFLAQTKHNIQYLPIMIAGVSHHDKNTVFDSNRTHWDYSYATFMTEIANAGVVSNSMYELNVLYEDSSKKHRSFWEWFQLLFGNKRELFFLLLRLKIRAFYATIRRDI